MQKTREIGVGLLGLGNVGSGVVKVLQDNAQGILSRLGAKVTVKRIGVRETEKKRLVDVDKKLVTTDVEAVIDDPNVDIVVELIGGDDPARDYVLRAIARKKNVVTANKYLLALHGDALFQAAEKAGVDIYYEASVCGGVPVIRTLREGMSSDRIHSLHGIVNGTSNFILTMMREEKKSFEEVLRLAQAAGYAEADPSLDVDGGDASHKLTILMMLAFGTSVSPKDIYVEGLRELGAVDFDYAQRFGYIIKPLVIAREHEDGLEARVHPAMIPKRWLMASVDGVNNAVYVSSYALGQSMYYGAGAGMMPTAMAVVADVIEVARNILAGAAGAVPMRSYRHDTERSIRDMGMLVSRYYLRFCVLDQPGVLATIARILGERRISISQVLQEGAGDPDRPVTLVVLTHNALERDLQAALKEIGTQPAVVDRPRLIRIVE